MGFLKEAWEGFTNYLNATKEEIEKEWDMSDIDMVLGRSQ